MKNPETKDTTLSQLDRRTFIKTAGVAGAASPADVARGKYVFGAAAGCGCHTEPKGARRLDRCSQG